MALRVKASHYLYVIKHPYVSISIWHIEVSLHSMTMPAAKNKCCFLNNNKQNKQKMAQ